MQAIVGEASTLLIMTQTLLSLRLAEPSDASALAALAERTFRDTFTHGNNPSDLEQHCTASFGRDSQLKEIEDPNIVTILAESGNRFEGFAQLHLCSPKECVPTANPCELHRFYVSSKHHGKGLAHVLMQRVLETAQQTSAESIWLGVWEENPRAITFYKKFGFEVVGSHTFLLGSDPQSDLIMLRDVTS